MRKNIYNETALDILINNNEDEIVEKFKLTLDYLEKVHKMVHEVDYLISGDTGEDSFMKNWQENKLP